MIRAARGFECVGPLDEPGPEWDGECRYVGDCANAGTMTCDRCDLRICCACGGYVQLGLRLVEDLN